MRLSFFLVGISLFAATFFASRAHGGSTEREIAFENDGVKLAGTLLVPNAPGPHPGIVLVHGSGPGPRTGLRPLAERFVDLGLAALIFDKRGSGASSGSWTSASLDDLANDAIAAVEFLRRQNETAGRHVGVCGVSQAGWVIPHAAALRGDSFDFAIIVTGGALKPADLERHDYAAALDHAGATTEQKAQALALVEQYLAYLKTGDGRAALDQKIAASQHEPSFGALNLQRVMPDEESRAKWKWIAEYDPLSDIRAMRIPVLVMLAGRDRPDLSGEMLARWGSALNEHKDATVIQILNADHGMTLPGTHHVASHETPQFVPGYIDLVGAWLRAHNFVN